MKQFFGIAFLLLLIIISPAHSQVTLNDKLNNIYQLQPEKIWVHTDRSIYVPGDTIFFSAKLTLGDLPSPESTVLYAELWDGEGKKIEDKVFPIAQAHSQGAFVLSNISKGPFLLRAYTAASVLHSPYAIFQKTILLSSDSAISSLKEVNEDFTQITLQQSSGQVLFNLFQPDEHPAQSAYHILGFLNRQLIYKAPVDLRTETVLGGRLPLPKNPNGELELVLINEQHALKGYASLKITNSSASAILQHKLESTSNGGSNLLLNWNDTIGVQLSVSITPQETIALHTADDRRNAIAYWKWALFQKAIDNPVSTYPYISWQGQLKKSLLKKFQGKELTLILSAAAQNPQYLTIPVDAEGKFEITSLIYTDSARLYYMEKGRKQVYAIGRDEIIISDNLLSEIKKPKAPALPYPMPDRVNQTVSTPVILNTYSGYLQNNQVKILEEVKVQAIQQREVDKLDRSHTTGAFTRTENTKIFTPDQDPAFFTSLNVLDYLRNRIPGMEINISVTENAVMWRGSPTALFLDEISQNRPSMSGTGDNTVEDASTIISLPMSQIAMVKVYDPPFLGAWGNGAGGAISVYIKNTSDKREALPPAKPIARGFSRSTDRNALTPTSLSLYWNPQVIFQGKQNQLLIPIPKNEFGGKLVVQIQGMDTRGSLIDKTIILP